MKKFILQITFEDKLQELLLSSQEHVNKYGDFISPYGSCVHSLACKYEGNRLIVKQPQSQTEQILESILKTLEYMLQIPLYFNENDSESVENVTDYVKEKIYQEYVNEAFGNDPELHILIYYSLTNSRNQEYIHQFVSQLPGDLPIIIDFIALPYEICKMYGKDVIKSKEAGQVALDNLHSTISIKNELCSESSTIKINNIYLLQNYDENNYALNLDKRKLAELFGNLLLSFIEGYDYIAQGLRDNPITTFGIATFEIDKYAIINNWSSHIFKQLCYNVIGDPDEQKLIDKEKVDKIFREILGEERQAIEQINGLPDENIQDFISNWKGEFQEKIINKILDASLTNAEKDLFLSYFQNIVNRDLLQLEDFDLSKLDLFDSLYIPYVEQMTENGNIYSQVRDILLQIQTLKEKMKKRKQRIIETHKLIDIHYHKDGVWTDEGYKIGKDIFKIHKTDLIGDGKSDDLLSDYTPNLTCPLPPSADLKSYFPPIKNQGNQGACASFSLTSVFEYFLSNETHKYEDLSEAFVYYNARDLNGKTSEDDGANLHDVIRGMVEKGVCVEELCAYDSNHYDNKPSEKAYKDGETRKVKSAKSVAVSVDVIKAAINEGYPVVCCFKVFKSLQNNTSGFIPMPTEEERKNDDGFHAMVICGYNDKHGHFIVRNSWGKGFGDQGYCYLPYSYVRDTDLTRYAVAITGIDAKEFIQHNPINDDFNLESKDKNIQYAILLNMLNEDKHQLTIDRQKIKDLIQHLKETINRLKSDEVLDDLQQERSKKIEQLNLEQKQLENEITTISIWDNKPIHYISGGILIASVIAICLGLYESLRSIMFAGVISACLSVLLWIVLAIVFKKKKVKVIQNIIRHIEQEKEKQDVELNNKISLRNKVVQILNAIGDIDEVSKENKELFNLIIKSLNDCYHQIRKYLRSNYPTINNDDEVLFPEWYGEIKDNIKITNFLQELLSSSNVKESLCNIQKLILDKLNALFNKTINDLYDNGNSYAWASFCDRARRLSVFAQVDDVAYPENAKNGHLQCECDYFMSNLDNTVEFVDVKKTDIYSRSKNRFIFIKIKKVDISALTIFRDVSKN